jgi:hypothetical protein
LLQTGTVWLYDACLLVLLLVEMFVTTYLLVGDELVSYKILYVASCIILQVFRVHVFSVFTSMCVNVVKS